PNHELLNYPNKITEQDFEGWVQERGLYFPNKWSDEFTPILSMKDKGETAKDGSLLVARHGKGYYIYTGLSFLENCLKVFLVLTDCLRICCRLGKNLLKLMLRLMIKLYHEVPQRSTKFQGELQ